ncbi:hypothetical protein CRG98_027470 [Punica granatum]|uniref:Protein SHORTAGE IN CHIASMATA 1 n=1 Tax=Punica granatum TaxID=22663 RepID=A0A2I0J737_PUNGR|nr:hypothetical protein CRG98_027470 [Punica granatum]
MRSRFLNVDYFISSSTPSSASFFNLPIPHLRPPSDHLSTTQRFLWFGSPQIIDVPLEIDDLRIEAALSKLLADVVPRKIGVRDGSYGPALSSNEAAPENGNGECESGECVVDKGVEFVEIVQFEIPELDMHLVWLIASDGLLQDVLNQGVEIPYNHETEESLYCFRDIGLENLVEPKADLVEDDCSVQGPSQFHFPLLEVDEICFGTLACMSMEDELAALLEKIEDQLLPQNEDFSVTYGHTWTLLERALLESPSYDCPSNKCSEADFASVEIFLEIDFISIGDTICPEVNLGSYQRMEDENHIMSFNPVVLEELQILDVGPASSFEVFNSSKFQEQELCDKMSKGELSCKSFDEMIVSHELALVDDMFKPLPIPILSDCKAMKSLYELNEKAIIGLKPQPLSASDEIYLDWLLLEEEKRSSAMCSSFRSMIVAIDIQSIDFDWRTASISEVVLDFLLSDYDSDGLIAEKCGKTAEILISGGSILSGHAPAASNDFEVGQGNPTNQPMLSEENLKRASSVLNSMSSFNDLDFFLNPSKARTKKKNPHPAMSATDKVQSDNSMPACDTVDWHLPQRDFILHQVHLSDDLIAVTENLKSSYLGILESNLELKEVHRSFQEADEYSLLSVSKLVFMGCIKNLVTKNPTLPSGGELVMASATLCAIKQITWYLCFYGIHTAWSYLDKLCEGFDCFATKLRVVQCFLVDTDKKADVVRISSHPSLSAVKEILLSSISENGLKALLVADKVFWSALKMLLTSLGISSCEMNESTQYPIPDKYNHGDFSIENMRLPQVKACLLASPENISADFPFDKFEMILEYGGSCGSSRITTLLPKMSGMPCLHFLKVEVDKSSAAGALCEGVSMAQHTGMGMIFEGETSFLATMMESSDGLYAVAASLGIDLQLFCSDSAELTDEIILSCIDVGTRFIKGLFPKLPESETSAESFLSKFPSINPLTAHAIVSNGGILADFLEWSNESRINAVQKYHVPNESISLFSALCRCGEREDSQSVMTDSSSSVSSAPNSRNCRGNLGSENKRCKYMRNPHNSDVPVDNSLQFEPAKQSIDSGLKFPELSKYNSWEFPDPKGCESSLQDLHGAQKGLDPRVTGYPSRVAISHDFDLPKDAPVWNVDSVHPDLRSNEATISGLDWLSSRNSEVMTEEVRGEGIDLVDPAVFNPVDFSFLVQDMDYDPIKEEDYPFCRGKGRSFPTVAEIESSSYCPGPVKHQSYSSRGEIHEFHNQEQNNERLHLNYQRTHSDADFERTSSRSLPSMTLQGGRSNFRGTPLRNALHSSHLLRSSPWTVEFLNRIREKSKMRQQSLPPETSPCPSIRRNTPNRAKRRSPSILEFFKYQGGSTDRKIPEQKRQKTSSQSLCSFKNEKAMSVAQSCTPADKRARREWLSRTTGRSKLKTRKKKSQLFASSVHVTWVSERLERMLAATRVVSAVWGSPLLEVIALKWTPITLSIGVAAVVFWASLVLTDSLVI